MTELLVPFAWINPHYGINLILIGNLAIFQTMGRSSFNINEQPELGIWQRSMLIVLDHCLQELESGGQTLQKIYLITHLIHLLNYFLLVLNFVFSKTKMFKLLVVIILIETLHTLSILIFACTYFCELKNHISRVLMFANGKLLKILSL